MFPGCRASLGIGRLSEGWSKGGRNQFCHAQCRHSGASGLDRHFSSARKPQSARCS